MKLHPALFALALGAFGIGLTEFAPMGLLPVIAGSLHVTIPAAGLLISAYAMGVVLGAPLMTLTTGRLPRRSLLIGLTIIFTLGNVLAALSHGYGMLVAARVITSFNHGAFFGVGAVVAAGLVPPDRRASAVAIMFMGLPAASIAGLPLATWAGAEFGWRPVFWAIAGIGLVTLAALSLTLPRQPAPAGGSLGAELRVLLRGQVLVALALTMIGFSAMFTVFTYIVPILRSEAHVSLGFVSGALVLFGGGLAIGNWLGGRYADRSVDKTLAVTLALLTALLLGFAVAMPHAIAATVLLCLWGAASFALVPPLQLRVMTAAADAPNLASAMNIGAFNLGNAVGAAAGGAVISGGFGYPAVAVAAAVAAAIGLCVVLLSRQRAAPANRRGSVSLAQSSR